MGGYYNDYCDSDSDLKILIFEHIILYYKYWDSGIMEHKRNCHRDRILYWKCIHTLVRKPERGPDRCAPAGQSSINAMDRNV